MTKQYQTEGTVPVTAPQQAKNTTGQDLKLQQLEKDIAALQRELTQHRRDMAKLKNRISDLERDISPRG